MEDGLCAAPRWSIRVVSVVCTQGVNLPHFSPHGLALSKHSSLPFGTSPVKRAVVEVHSDCLLCLQPQTNADSAGGCELPLLKHAMDA